MEDEKQIERMAKDSGECDYPHRPCEKCWCREAKECSAYAYAESFYNAGYQNCKDKVVLTMEEYETLKNESAEIAKDYQEMARFYDEKCEELEQSRKEGAREALQRLGAMYGHFDDEHKTSIYYLRENLKELAKEWDVEVE